MFLLDAVELVHALFAPEHTTLDQAMLLNPAGTTPLLRHFTAARTAAGRANTEAARPAVAQGRTLNVYVASVETVAPVAASVPLTRKVTVYVPAALNARLACVCAPAASGLVCPGSRWQ